MIVFYNYKLQANFCFEMYYKVNIINVFCKTEILGTKKTTKSKYACTFHIGIYFVTQRATCNAVHI